MKFISNTTPLLLLIVIIIIHTIQIISTAEVDNNNNNLDPPQICSNLAKVYDLIFTTPTTNPASLQTLVSQLQFALAPIPPNTYLCPPFQHRARSNYGYFLSDLNQLEESIVQFAIATNEAVQSFPHHGSPHDVIIPALNLVQEASIHSLATIPQLDEIWDVIFKFEPDNRSQRLHKLVELPWMPRTTDEIDRIYSNLELSLASLLADEGMKCATINVGGCDESPQRGSIWSPLYVPYYHLYSMSKLSLIAKDLSKLYSESTSSLAWLNADIYMEMEKKVTDNKTVHVVFVSAFMTLDHSLGQHISGVVAQLSLRKDKFKITIVHITEGGVKDSYKFILNDQESLFLNKDQGYLSENREKLAGLKPDVIIYPEIGMDSHTYFLAFARIAPIQVATWGFPASLWTGEIDYFISAEGLELDPTGGNNQHHHDHDHHGEQVVLLGEGGVPPWFFYFEDAHGGDSMPEDRYEEVVQVIEKVSASRERSEQQEMFANPLHTAQKRKQNNILYSARTVEDPPRYGRCFARH